jgi:hypothetical protein
MARKFEKVYQFKVSLKGIKPPIWRRIQVPETYSFWDLHVAIQDAMGWMDCHLHHFEIENPQTGFVEEIGIPGEEGWEELDTLPGWDRKISKYFSNTIKKAHYLYDYGDCWEHDIKLEKILPKDPKSKYPLCTGGKRACPPEDCGGVWGYSEFLEIIMDPNHERYEEMTDWLGGNFDPEHFDMNKVRFDDPAERRKFAFG